MLALVELFERIKRRLVPPKYLILEVVGAYMQGEALVTAARLGIPDLLRHGPLSSHELASTLGLLEAPLYRYLRALASLGVLRALPARRFAATRTSAALSADGPGSVKLAATYLGGAPRLAWGALATSLASGKPAIEHVLGQPYFEYLAGQPEAARQFRAMMALSSEFFDAAILGAVSLAGERSVVDVGGGEGQLLFGLLERHPQLQGTLFDQPDVVAAAARSPRGRALEARCTFAGGDLFGALPAGAELYLMKCVLHDFDDALALRLLHGVRAAMGNRGRLLICDLLVAPEGDTWMNYSFDLTMLLMHGGRERSVDDLDAMLAATGFSLRNVTRTATIGVLEAVPV